jgi:hypothetical protein
MPAGLARIDEVLAQRDANRYGLHIVKANARLVRLLGTYSGARLDALVEAPEVWVAEIGANLQVLKERG